MKYRKSQTYDSISPIIFIIQGNTRLYASVKDPYFVVKCNMGDLDKFGEPIMKNMLKNRYKQGKKGKR